jgi:Protein of unknown function (DUF1571)
MEIHRVFAENHTKVRRVSDPDQSGAVLRHRLTSTSRSFTFMAPTHSAAERSLKSRLRSLLWLIPALAAGLGLASWWFTEPLKDRPTAIPRHRAESDAAPALTQAFDALPAWPEVRLAGDEAKSLLLVSALRSTARLERIECYTATLRKQERLSGKLGPEWAMRMKVRNHPFAIYLKFLSPKAGKEVVYAEGHHDNKVIAHNGDWTRKIVPRLAVAPDSPLALADQRHPVTEAGLLHLANKLLHFRKLDIGDTDAQTVLDRTTDAEGRIWFRSVHTHAVADGTRPFAKVEVLYEPVNHFPLRISSYDWPASGHVGELELAERYAYDDLKLNAPLTAADFDPANPGYAFMRY